MRKVYIAGPMRGLPLSNFPAFDRAKALGMSKGWTVISPADMDRIFGYDPADAATSNSDVLGTLSDIMLRDLAELANCNALALLPGWENSTGARVEVMFALFVGNIQLLDAETFEPANIVAILWNVWRLPHEENPDT